MNIADPKYLEYLRDLPTSYLLDLMADNEGMDIDTATWVLLERGLNREDIDSKVQRRRRSTWMRPYTFWAIARWLTIFNTLIVTYFNMTGLYQLLHSEHPFKGPMLFCAVASIVAGFIVGFKLTTHVYHGSKSQLFCGFPFPVGYVELKTGEETLHAKRIMNFRMAVNALVGVSFTLFPLILISFFMN